MHHHRHRSTLQRLYCSALFWSHLLDCLFLFFRFSAQGTTDGPRMEWDGFIGRMDWKGSRRCPCVASGKRDGSSPDIKHTPFA
ncbi:uncharacterized protein IWZ02DRAFT_466591 [Phyllosticta citriasiana]|uniref:uncharacterized protein n=1 Tax=Phyllosticta citriasiana TaxID=595635 RepID=UPI0030FDB948